MRWRKLMRFSGVTGRRDVGSLIVVGEVAGGGVKDCRAGEFSKLACSFSF